MKKKICMILVLVVAALCVLLVALKGKPFDDVDAGELDEVIIYYPGDRETEVAEPDSLEKIVQLLQAMKLRRTLLARDMAGYMMAMDIYDSDGRKQTITISAPYVTTDGKWYTCDRDYCDDFRKLCEELWSNEDAAFLQGSEKDTDQSITYEEVGSMDDAQETNDIVVDMERLEEENHISVTSPDGKYRAETVGEEELGGRTYPDIMRVVDLQTERVLWEETAYLDTAFLWSPDSKYLAIAYSGRTWSECKMIDTASWQEIPDIDIPSIQKLADDLPDIYENGTTKIIPTQWSSEDTICLELYWDTPDGKALTGTVQYNVQTQEYEELKWELVSVG